MNTERNVQRDRLLYCKILRDPLQPVKLIRSRGANCFTFQLFVSRDEKLLSRLVCSRVQV